MSLHRAIQAFGSCRFPDVLTEEILFDPSLLKVGVWDPGEIEIEVLGAEDCGQAIEVDLVVSCCPTQGAGCCATGPDRDLAKRIRLVIDKALGVAIAIEQD
jgi:hypothetical protein